MVRAKKRCERLASSSARISMAPGMSMSGCNCGQDVCSCPCTCCSSCLASGTPPLEPCSYISMYASLA